MGRLGGLAGRIKYKLIIHLPFVFFMHGWCYSQELNDSSRSPATFSGSLGFTNNGFSIIPTFSFNSPAALALLFWKKDKFSIDPDIRVTPDGKKGSILLWLRYYPVQGERFTLRAGVHPAVNWMPIDVEENGGVSTELIRMRRFLAWELSPAYTLNEHMSVGLYYLQGNGLQTNGPRTTHFVNLNTTVSDLKIARQMKFAVTPAFYYLSIDDEDGTYFTANALISHNKLPLTFQSTINKTINSNIDGNKDFMWNVAVFYDFKKRLAN